LKPQAIQAEPSMPADWFGGLALQPRIGGCGPERFSGQGPRWGRFWGTAGLPVGSILLLKGSRNLITTKKEWRDEWEEQFSLP
jgi:hypothetical protein